MPTGRELVDWCLTQIGVGYSWVGRFGPDAYDCSGLMVAALRANDAEVGGWNSTGQETWCRDAGLGLDVPAAEGIAGAPVFIWGSGAAGHVAMSMGDGRVIETPSNSHGGAVGISPFWSGRTHNGWTGAGLWPGIDYGLDLPVPGDPVLRYGSRGDVVADWQRFLGAEVGRVDGDFGPWTEQRVKEFQALMGLPVDGVIGQATWGTRRLVEAIPPITVRPAPPEEDRMKPGLFLDNAGAVWIYDPYQATKKWVRNDAEYDAVVALRRLAGIEPAEMVRNATTDALLANAVLVGPEPEATP